MAVTTTHDYPSRPCRLCGTNVIDQLVEQVAEDYWESRRRGSMHGSPWSEAEPMWQQSFRELGAF